MRGSVIVSMWCVWNLWNFAKRTHPRGLMQLAHLTSRWRPEQCVCVCLCVWKSVCAKLEEGHDWMCACRSRKAVCVCVFVCQTTEEGHDSGARGRPISQAWIRTRRELQWNNPLFSTQWNKVYKKINNNIYQSQSSRFTSLLKLCSSIPSRT